MAGPVSTKPLVGWQRANVLAAAQYLVQRLRVDPADRQAQAICEGLLDVLKPTRRSERRQRELAASKAILVPPDERKGLDPRSGLDRRTSASTALAKAERRKRERRLRRDRRKS
jgi:hypothetical protein